MLALPLLIAFADLLALSTCSPAVALHEARQGSASLAGLTKHDVQPDTVVNARIMMKQPNLAKGEELLMQISDPGSPQYGKHLTQAEVATLFMPDDKGKNAVGAWLAESGVPSQAQVWSRGSGWLQFQTTVGKLEQLLSAQYSVYENPKTKEQFLGAPSYSLPVSVSEYVDFVTPGVSLIKKRNVTITERPHRFRGAATRPASKDAVGCDQVITPECIRAQYKIPLGHLNSRGSMLGIYEEDDEIYRQLDLDAFFQSYSDFIPKGTHPKLDLMNFPKGVRPDPNLAQGEAALDLQIAMPLIYPQRVELYQSHDELEGNDSISGFLAPWLDAIDGSYCTYDGGDDPSIDGDRPNKMCGAFKPTPVISVSYGLDEYYWGTKYNKRQCYEFMKLGLQGTTVVFSSGDGGVAGGHGDVCLGPDGTGDLEKVFNPQAPASCPYVTSVGATTLAPGSQAGDEEMATVNFASGGGFSNIWTTPSYQKDHLDKFFQNHKPDFPGYNTSDGIAVPGGVYNQAGRGFPDVAALGDNAVVVTDGLFALTGGTSMSAPLFAAIMTRVVDERLHAGKKPLGFINPALYKNPSMFNDIVKGNQGLHGQCDGKSFSAVSGWDPVTGLGTPKYPELLKYFVSLP